nr:PEPxxWA-CTERM sorting domain-containing protein [Polymorphobacter megasporae]
MIRPIRRATLAFAGTASLIIGMAPAHAGYSVSTFANTGRSYNRGCAALYNSGRTGAGFINNDGGGSNCDPSAYSSFQTVTVSGTTDTTGTLTRANDYSSVVSVTGLPDTAVATSSADLATAKIYLTASAAGPLAGANASAQLADTLHFTIAGANASTITYVPVSFAFSGTVATTDYDHASAELGYGFYFGGASAYEFGDYGAGYYGGNYRSPTFVYASDPRVGGWVSSSFASYTPTDTRFSGVYAITGATADIPISFNLSLNTYNSTLDYSNGGGIKIGHVDGVSYTSDSGVFLTSVAGAVPEPASWAMLVAGFGIVGGAARRRRIAVAA